MCHYLKKWLIFLYSAFKLYLLDVGLLGALSNTPGELLPYPFTEKAKKEGAIGTPSFYSIVRRTD